MRFHFRVSDPSVVPWVPVCKRRVLAIYNSGVRWYDRFEDWGLFIVQMRINNEEVYVNLIGKGEAYFEFQTSGFPIDIQSVTVSGEPLPIYLTGVVGVSISKGVATAKLLGGKRTLLTGEVSRIGHENQINLLDEPVRYYSATVNTKASQHYPRMVYETYSPTGSQTGVHYHDYHAFFQTLTVHTFLGSPTSHFMRDRLADTEWSDNTNFDPIRFASLEGTAADWPRRAGIQLVTSKSYGTREFAVSVDAFDQVSVFPVSAIGPRDIDLVNMIALLNVDSASIKMERVPFPAWVYAKTERFKDWYEVHKGGTGEEAAGLYEFPEYDWRFHPDGTKMCTVVHERELATFNSAYFAPYETDITTQGPGTYWPDQTSFDLMNAVTMGVTSLHAGMLTPGDPYYMSAPGILEVSIDIVLTGPNPEDFTLDLTATEVRRPTTSQYCSMAAGYCWYDIKATTYTDETPVFDARRGDLCTLDVECYGRLSDSKAADLYSLKNITQATEIRTFGASSTYTAGSIFSGIPSLVAFKFETLSFVFKYRNEVKTTDTYPKREMFFGVSVYVLNRYKHTFFPTTMPEAQQTAILSKVDVDMRAAMVAEFGSLTLMPLNDLADWTNSRM